MFTIFPSFSFSPKVLPVSPLVLLSFNRFPGASLAAASLFLSRHMGVDAKQSVILRFQASS